MAYLALVLFVDKANDFVYVVAREALDKGSVCGVSHGDHAWRDVPKIKVEAVHFVAEFLLTDHASNVIKHPKRAPNLQWIVDFLFV